MFDKNYIKEQGIWLIEIAAVVSLSFILIFHIWETDFSVLLENQEDVIGLAVKAQEYISGIERTQLLAMPFEQEEIATLDGSLLHLFLLRILTLFCNSFGLAGNLLYLAGYILTAVCMYATLKMIKIHNAIAAVLSVIFAFLPYHYLRGEKHVYLGMYYMVPLICLIVLWMLEGGIRLKKKMKKEEKQRFFFASIIAMLLALSDTYYMVFACILLLFAGLASTMKRKDKGHIAAAFLLCFIMLSLICFINIPYISMIMSGQQRDAAISERGLDDLERYGLRIAQLLLPIQNHRIKYLAKIRADYDAAILQNESGMATLGLVTSCGFCFSLFGILVCAFKSETGRKIKQLGTLNIVCVLVAGIGGFNVFVGMISSGIRCYNRFSVYIAVFSIMTIAAILQSLLEKIKAKKIKIYMFFPGLAVLLILALYEQTPDYNRENYQKNLFFDSNTRDMVSQIEGIVPDNSMIFMMPILTEKEDSRIYSMRNYEQQWPVVYSDTLRWSATSIPVGIEGMKNHNRQWKNALSLMTVDKILENISVVGFEGIWLDENGYSESEFMEIKSRLEKYLGNPLCVSMSGKQYYYTLSDYTAELKKGVTDEIWNQMKDASLALGNGYAKSEDNRYEN